MSDNSVRNAANDAVELTQTLLRMNTINPPGNEDQCTMYLAELLSAAGYDCRLVDFAPHRSTLVARIGGHPDKPPICFTGHVDVVPLGTAPWRYDPFGAEIMGDKLYGRGSSDMKSGVAAFTIAAIAVADEIKDSAGLTLIITAGEEIGCEGAFHLAGLKDVAEIIGKAGALVVAEPTSNEPMVGHKGALWLKASATGVTAHGSMPEAGDNAIYKIARAALAMEEFNFSTPAHTLMGQGTLNVGTARGGLNINSVPDAAEMTIDIRTVAGQDHGQIWQCLCNRMGSGIGLQTLLDIDSVFTEPDNPWIQTVFARCQPLFDSPLKPKTISYFTDAAALRGPLGMPPTVILGPGELDMAHQTDEFCYVARIGEAEKLFRHIMLDWNK
ncbi:M20 family metallopeptidase [Actimicrobium sp. CCI2.3]|uniref:M20 family metallopeptidase n=1 Tax=Actimicrobium sp. CCI2.3 TaxID=3048616 RepID=UPI002AB51A61|nr:M20 family metallopeptidase [Actimicrobium sp. CCI2.3]MDY7573043.1 M20 family metallopeptidase [Actimicrobium sp. CCI2.3]MEB0020841.1 M20 family metallopeptidase [Actimicrobium sp. CCI2.3]